MQVVLRKSDVEEASPHQQRRATKKQNPFPLVKQQCVLYWCSNSNIERMMAREKSVEFLMPHHAFSMANFSGHETR